MTFILSFLFYFSPAFAAPSAVPQTHIEKGCRCLECPYFHPGQKIGIWKTRKDLPFYSAPDSPTPVYQARANEKVVAIGGEVHTKPGKLEVIFSRKKYKVGDTVYILLEDAEMGYKVWHNGLVEIEDLSNLVSQKQSCGLSSEKCWARVIEPVKTTWWVQFQTKNHKRGWSKEVEKFDFDRSACLD